MKKILDICRQLALAACVMATLAGVTQAGAAPAQSGVIVQLFEWHWDDVAQECEQFLGPHGYAAVQVSPPEEHIQGAPWYTRYQPVSYQLQSRSGSAGDFANMVSRCNAVGVAVYADAVINHMAYGSGTGTAGTYYNSSNLNYAVYSSRDFHAPCSINDEDYRNSAHRVRTCRLSGLPDLDTGSGYVQQTIADYLNRLLNLGVKGFRIDAAKHMAPGGLAGILNRVNGNPDIYQEVIDPGNEAISASDYLQLGDVTEFRYGSSLGDVFKNGQLKNLRQFGQAWGFIPDDSAVVFTDNHDTQRTGGNNILTYRDGSLYNLANVFMLAWPYGRPRLMSSYAFDYNDQGPPATGVYQNGKAQCGDAWVCEHRWTSIANMVQFRNVTNGEDVTNWWDDGNDRIAFGRGNKGFVVINRESGTLNRTFDTNLTDGSYANVAGEGCATVAGSQISVNVASMEAAAFRVGAPCGDSGYGSGVASVNFSCHNGTTRLGQSVYATGVGPELGNWEPSRAVKLNPSAYPTWTAAIALPVGKTFEWKCIKRDEQDPTADSVWQSGNNNVVSSAAGTSTAGAF